MAGATRSSGETVTAGRRIVYRRLLWVGPLAGLAAAVLNAAVFLGASAIGVASQDIVVHGRGQ